MEDFPQFFSCNVKKYSMTMLALLPSSNAVASKDLHL